jgi:hypothetical protein
MKFKTYKMCQSCGMPIKKDPQFGGTNLDGSRSNMYCSYCYQNGEFIFKSTVKEMQIFCKEKMMEQGTSKFIAWMFTRGIPRLERWKK